MKAKLYMVSILFLLVIMTNDIFEWGFDYEELFKSIVIMLLIIGYYGKKEME